METIFIFFVLVAIVIYYVTKSNKNKKQSEDKLDKELDKKRDVSVTQEKLDAVLFEYIIKNEYPSLIKEFINSGANVNARLGNTLIGDKNNPQLN